MTHKYTYKSAKIAGYILGWLVNIAIVLIGLGVIFAGVFYSFPLVTDYEIHVAEVHDTDMVLICRYDKPAFTFDHIERCTAFYTDGAVQGYFKDGDFITN